jgi:hypothetical protein
MSQPVGPRRTSCSLAEAKEIVRAAEEPNLQLGTYMIEADGWEDATHYLVVRGAAEAAWLVF